MSAAQVLGADALGRVRRVGGGSSVLVVAPVLVLLGGSVATPAWASAVASSTSAGAIVSAASSTSAGAIVSTVSSTRAAELEVAGAAAAPPIGTTTAGPALAAAPAPGEGSSLFSSRRGRVVAGVRPVWGVAGAIAEQGHALDVTFGLVTEVPGDFVGGLVGAIGVPLAEYSVARGEEWSGDLRVSAGVMHLQRLVALGDEAGPHLELQAGGQAEFMYVSGQWRVPSPCLAATAACEGSTYSADTRRLGARILAGVGATGLWGRWRLSLTGWLGPELATGALDFEGLVTPATRARFEALTTDGRVSGVVLVAALQASLAVTFGDVGGER